MMFKRILLSFSLAVGIGLPARAMEPEAQTNSVKSQKTPVESAKDQLIQDHKSLKKINDIFGSEKYERSFPREIAERLILSLMHNGISIKDGKLSVDAKKALTETRDGFFRVAAYKTLDKAVMEALQKAGQFKTDAEIKKYTTKYKTYGSPLVSDGLDVIFRGIKYFNDDAKEHTAAAYVKNDLAPYLVKKKIVWLTHFAIHKALEQSEHGRKFLAIYELAQLIPFIGIELEDAPKTILEFLYDKGLEKGKLVAQKYVIPKIKSLRARYHIA